MSADVLDQLGEIDQADVVRCARVLLRRPLLRVGGQDGELLSLVYRHRAVLTDLFAGLLGYRLVVERRFARLYKTGPGQDPTRGEPTLTPRGYAYLALALAALTTVGQQTLLSRLVTDIRAAGTQAGVAVTDDLGDLGSRPRDRARDIADLRERIAKLVERREMSARTGAQLDALLTQATTAATGRTDD